MRMSGRSPAGGNRGILIKNHQVALFSDLVSFNVAELRLAPFILQYQPGLRPGVVQEDQ